MTALRPRIRVGIVGANPNRWGGTSHAPAVRSLPELYELVAVCTTRVESAREAAQTFEAPYALTDHFELVRHEEVDLVAVVVRVPAHEQIVHAALTAGKHVYCEWPLARDVDEARSLLSAAQEAGVHHAIGLQARFSPALRRAQDLIADGYVGKVMSVNAYAASPAGAGGVISAATAYALDDSNYATLMHIAAAHTVDAVESLVGPITELSAIVSQQQSSYRIDGTESVIESAAPNQVTLTARTAEDAAVSFHVHNGKVSGGHTRLEISGSSGDLVLEAHGRRGVQSAELQLRGSQRSGWKDLDLLADNHGEQATNQPWSNVARLYAGLADDIRTGGSKAPDFAAAVRLHEVVRAITESSDTGARLDVLAA